MTNTVYKGVHLYGKRSKKEREVISRPYPAIVSDKTWEDAQQTLKANQIFSDRNARNKYLLRGLVKCSHCGLSYVGCSSPNHRGQNIRYYHCNGKTAYRGPYQGKCPNKAIKADDLEEAVWKEVENILLDPEIAIRQLNEIYLNQETQQATLEIDRSLAEKSLSSKQDERERIIDLYKRKFISIEDLEKQLTKITEEKDFLKQRLVSIESKARQHETAQEKAKKAEELLVQLQEVLQNPLPWEIKRQVVELLIWDIRLDKLATANTKETKIIITFAFEKSSVAVNCTDIRAMLLFLAECMVISPHPLRNHFAFS